MGELAPGPLTLALCLLAATAAGAEPATGVRAGWTDLSLLNASEARTAFAAAAQADPASRDARLGLALSLLQLRARTPSNIAAAGEWLKTLRNENAADDAGIAATYYLARIQQMHGYTPNRSAAVEGYRALLAAHPGHYYAQLAAPKLALLLLYDDVPPDEWERRVTEVSALIHRLTTPEALRDTRLILATAFIRLRLDHARAYPLMSAALAAGSVTRLPRLNALLVQAAESAQVLGKRSEAADYYAHFLAEFPHDAKSDEIRRRLDDLNRKAGS